MGITVFAACWFVGLLATYAVAMMLMQAHGVERFQRAVTITWHGTQHWWGPVVADITWAGPVSGMVHGHAVVAHLPAEAARAWASDVLGVLDRARPDHVDVPRPTP